MSLEYLRHRIEVVDRKLLELLEERAKIAKTIGKEKQKIGQSPIYDPKREKEVLKKVANIRTPGVFPKSSRPFVFREIIAACRSIQGRFKVAVDSPQSELQAIKVFGQSMLFKRFSTPKLALKAFNEARVDFAFICASKTVERSLQRVSAKTWVQFGSSWNLHGSPSLLMIGPKIRKGRR